jgi:tetratricopeptide (TPR) repeat protein
LETGNRSKGIEKYINIILNSGLAADQSRQFFEMNLTDSMDYAILRVLLLKQIQKAPDNYILADLLKWTFIKQKDWNSAFIQTKALDKRLKENGARLIELGELCVSNEAWESAAQCFQYVKDLGEDKPFYIQSHAGLLETRYSKLKKGKAEMADMLVLEKDFNDFINRQGLSDYNWRAVSALSDLYSNYLHMPDKSIDLLEAYIKANGIKPRTIAAAKLVLGDAYVIDGDVWSSELLYAQVEMDYQEEALGQEAKFRRARLSYFRGEFNWAQIQLNVLKGATTQLISNNAIELALKISENLGIDSNYHALELYATAELLLEQNLLKEAELSLDSIISLYPGHSLSDDILYTRAGIREKQGLYAEAANLYETLAIAFSHDLLADNAWYKLGSLYENQLSKPDKAMECYKKILLDFPGSLFQADARKNYRRLRGDQI